LTGQAQNRRVVAHLNKIRSAVGIQSNVRSGGNARFAKRNRPRDRAAVQAAVVEKPGVSVGAWSVLRWTLG
jgi:hypothetical protein